MSVCPCIHLSVNLSIYLSVCFSSDCQSVCHAHPSISLSVCLSVCLTFCLIRPSFGGCLSSLSSIHLSVCLHASVFLPVHRYVCLSVPVNPRNLHFFSCLFYQNPTSLLRNRRKSVQSMHRRDLITIAIIIAAWFRRRLYFHVTASRITILRSGKYFGHSPGFPNRVHVFPIESSPVQSSPVQSSPCFTVCPSRHRENDETETLPLPWQSVKYQPNRGVRVHGHLRSVSHRGHFACLDRRLLHQIFWSEIMKSKSTQANNVIKQLDRIFATHGFPDKILTRQWSALQQSRTEE